MKKIFFIFVVCFFLIGSAQVNRPYASVKKQSEQVNSQPDNGALIYVTVYIDGKLYIYVYLGDILISVYEPDWDD